MSEINPEAEKNYQLSYKQIVFEPTLQYNEHTTSVTSQFPFGWSFKLVQKLTTNKMLPKIIISVANLIFNNRKKILTISN